MKRSPLVKVAMIVLLSLGSVGIVGGSFFLRKAFSSTSEPGIITDTLRYSEIRNQLWANNDEVKYFPNEISADAKSARIAYYPGFLQGGSYFQLRLKQSPEKIQKLLTQYRKLAKHKYIGGDTNDHANLPNGVPTTFFYTSDSGTESFPPTYEILVLNAQDRGSPGFKWNHGDSYGVAIDSAASEIVYWAERW
ncbi:hypothetical protein I8748_11895 [Nostoc sp. CENA67]|uniref:Uncharacterized protein n=1 Tax=Amazonocrinis nigriterrae CENA67 TaxID=2794033 RepID=A0A8J7HUX3_9NOST|nr:hypothetical protein [Amazonocrinis nigriterrae]MBH8562874.1 hypothetical protein [Amazonocrinis nigriterrae CENA67]